MTKKKTKMSTNPNGISSPKDSLKSIGSSRKSTVKKSNLYSSRFNSKSSPRVFALSPVASMQSSTSKGLGSKKVVMNDKKSPTAKGWSQAAAMTLYNNYFWNWDISIQKMAVFRCKFIEKSINYAIISLDNKAFTK